MNERLAAAQAALNSGRAADAIENLIAAVEADPAQTVQVYRILLVQLYQTGRYEEGERWGSAGVERFPRDFDLWNTLGVVRRRLKRYPQALQALDQAVKLSPANAAAQNNRGNVLMDAGEFARAEQVFAKLVRQDPRNSDYQRQYGRALINQGKRDAAFLRFRQAVSIRKDSIDAWLDMVGAEVEIGRYREAEELVDKALAANPGASKLIEAKVTVIRRSGDARRAEAFLLGIQPQHEHEAWFHYQLATVISDWDRERGNVHLRKAVELDPAKLDYLMALIESLERTRTGDEGGNIDQAYEMTPQAFAVGGFTPSHTKILNEVLVRVCAFDEIPQLGDFATLGRSWAESNRHTALLKQLPRVRTMEDRLELVEQHRIWGRQAVTAAEANPIRKPKPRPPRDKIRVGFMSSDLRNHPVAYFALPLFQHYDHERFEVYAYSFYQGGVEDQTQARIKDLSTVFRWKPDMSDRDVAQMIADDDLDMLIELGGSTHMNKLGVMAYKPAPLSASWVGYPLSAGLATIDYLVTDPYLLPEDPRLMIEKPLTLPHAWYALGPQAFRQEPQVNPQSPFERNGFITFGTANNPYKYSPDVLEAWAGVLNAVPESQFLFIRPEGSSKAFTRNVRALFARGGVGPDRVRFETVRGRHLPHYNDLDISLDTFPQTGGTTTCESLWMGVPVISMVGPAMFERLSYSVLMNLDLPELCARTPEQYVAAAAALANDRPRLNELRRTLRPRMSASHLGQTEAFARDYFEAIETAVRQGAVDASTPRASSST
jgi:predicted O-linked N-acetylglucosamine transferase (SPINDLY family)/Tfp pilus assembly protein PilF